MDPLVKKLSAARKIRVASPLLFVAGSPAMAVHPLDGEKWT
jgi:hypothetical protein